MFIIKNIRKINSNLVDRLADKVVFEYFFAIYNQREIFMINKYVRFIEEGEEF